MREKVDKTDLKLLAILDVDGRIPAAQLARKVGISKDAAIQRMAALEQKGVITGYYPVINLRRFGFNYHRLNIMTEALSRTREEEFVQFLSETIHASLLYKMDVPHQYGVCLWTQDVYDVDLVLKTIKRHLGDKFISYLHDLYTTSVQFPKDYAFEKKHHLAAFGAQEVEVIPFDERDIRILQALAIDGRMTTIAIAEKTGIPQTTVVQRMRTLYQKKVLEVIRANINPYALGLQQYSAAIEIVDPAAIEKVRTWAFHDPRTTWFETCIGFPDVALAMEVRSRAELDDMIQRLKERLPNIKKFMVTTEKYWRITYYPLLTTDLK